MEETLTFSLVNQQRQVCVGLKLIHTCFGNMRNNLVYNIKKSSLLVCGGSVTSGQLRV